MSSAAKWLVPGFMFLGWLVAAFIVVRFNLETMRIARLVQAAAAAEGKRWILLEDRRLLVKFVFRPNEIMEPNDGHFLAEQKNRLLAHRMQAKSTLLKAMIFFVGGILLAILIPLMGFLMRP
ncbi:MAG: hypothetical protein ACOY33_13435 [Pseudomonadota bacterium]